MKKYLVISIMVFIIGMLVSCASPGSLRQEIPFIYTITKGTPHDFSHCLVAQLDERFTTSTHILRDNPDGSATILAYTFLLDINKEISGLKILAYFSWCNREECRKNLGFLDVNESLNNCGAKEIK